LVRGGYKVSKLKEDVAHRALSHEDIQKVLNCPYPPPSPALHKTGDNILYEQFALDIWRFSYYTGGIDFSSIANIRQNDVFDGQLRFQRQKTHKWIQLPLLPYSLAIIEKYRKPNNDYLFPILDSNKHKTDTQQRDRMTKVLKKVNAQLKQIGEELGLPIKLTTYVARHSFATDLKRAGVPEGKISESLGHSNLQVTQHYLDSFGVDALREAFDKLQSKNNE
jgi:integrase